MQSDGSNIRPERPQGPLTEIERSEFYLREGERLAHMGSWSLRPDGVFDYWSPETFVIFDFDPAKGIPTLPQRLAVLHDDDRDRLAKRSTQSSGKASGPTSGTEALEEYSWPGNVRELQNVIERSLIIVDTNEFSVDTNWLSHEFQASSFVGTASETLPERQQIEAALAQTKGKVSGRQGAAAILGMPASALESKIRALRINKHAYKSA